MQSQQCLFQGKVMKDCKSLFFLSKKFLLQQGIPYILSERFCQDDLESDFEKQRAISRRCDNPTFRDFGYNGNTIKLHFSVRPIAGNVQGQLESLTE